MNKYRNHAQAWNARHVPILQIQRHMRACESSEDSYGLGITYFINLSSLMTGTFFLDKEIHSILLEKCLHT